MNTIYVLNILKVPHGLTGSLQGTSSYAPSSSHYYRPINATNVYVDLGKGDDSTGIRGDVSWPFASFTAASASALEGDTIWFRGGSYSSLQSYGNVTLSLDESARISSVYVVNDNLHVVGKGIIDYIDIRASVDKLFSIDIEANTINGMYTYFSTNAVKANINVSSEHIGYYWLLGYQSLGGYVSSSIKAKTMGGVSAAFLDLKCPFSSIRTDIQTNFAYGYFTNSNLNANTIVSNLNIKNTWVSPQPYFCPTFNKGLNIKASKIQLAAGVYLPSVSLPGSMSLDCSYFSGSSLHVPDAINLLLSGDPILSHAPIVTGSLHGNYTLL